MFSLISRAVADIQKLAENILELPAEEAENDENGAIMLQTVSSTVPPMADNAEIAPMPATAEVEIQTVTETVSAEVQTEEPDPLRGASERVRNTVGSLQKYIELIMNNQDEFNENPGIFAVNKGDLGFLAWLIKITGYTCDKQVYYNAIISKKTDFTRWCAGNNVPYVEEELIDLVAKYGLPEMFPQNLLSRASAEASSFSSYQCWEVQQVQQRFMRTFFPIWNKAVEYGNVEVVKMIANTGVLGRQNASAFGFGPFGNGMSNVPTNWDEYVRQHKKQ